MKIARDPKRPLGTLKVERAGLSDVNVNLARLRTRFNGITIILNRHELRIDGLPDNVGVLRLQLRRGVLKGRGGNVRARSRLAGEPAIATASAHSR